MCKNGERCRFLHPARSLRQRSPLRGGPPLEERRRLRSLEPKPITCVFWERGQCRNGERCRFLHAKAGPTDPPEPLPEETVEEIRRFLDRHGGQLEGGQVAANFPRVKKAQIDPHFELVPVGGGKFWVRLPGLDAPLPDDVPRLPGGRKGTEDQDGLDAEAMLLEDGFCQDVLDDQLQLQEEMQQQMEDMDPRLQPDQDLEQAQFQDMQDLEQELLQAEFQENGIFSEDGVDAGPDGEERLRRKRAVPSSKAVTCVFWQRGICRNGEACRFLHGTAPPPGPPEPLSPQMVTDIRALLERSGGQLEGGQVAATFIGVKKCQLEPHFEVVTVGGGKFWVRVPGLEAPLPEDRHSDRGNSDRGFLEKRGDASYPLDRERRRPLSRERSFLEVGSRRDGLDARRGLSLRRGTHDHRSRSPHLGSASLSSALLRGSRSGPVSSRRCLFYGRGVCRNGNACPFIHEARAPLRTEGRLRD